MSNNQSMDNRRQTLNKIARAKGYNGWSDYETQVFRKRISIPENPRIEEYIQEKRNGDHGKQKTS